MEQTQGWKTSERRKEQDEDRDKVQKKEQRIKNKKISDRTKFRKKVRDVQNNVRGVLQKTFKKDLKAKGKKRILKKTDVVISIKQNAPAEYVPIYFKTKFEEEKRQFFFE